VRWWKILGLAGFAGVAATGVVIARAERARRAYTPDEIREQLHARLAAASASDDAADAGDGLPPAARHRGRINGSGRRVAGPAGPFPPAPPPPAAP
jgi:hypothetical protein